MDSRFADELPYAFEGLQKLHEVQGVQGTVVPENAGATAGATADKLLRRRDCAVMSFH